MSTATPVLYAVDIASSSPKTSSLFDVKYALASLFAVENEQVGGGAGGLAKVGSVGSEMAGERS
jgi:hypothetical protein